MSSVRTFIAASLTTELNASIADIQSRIKTQVSGVCWTKPETIHLTLSFFDAATQETLEKIKVSMLSVKRAQSSFRVTLRGLKPFPNLRKPPILWLGLEPETPLQQRYKN